MAPEGWETVYSLERRSESLVRRWALLWLPVRLLELLADMEMLWANCLEPAERAPGLVKVPAFMG